MANRDGFWSSRKEAKNIGPVEKPRKRRRPLGFMPLEPRIMYDGAGAATAAAVAHHHHDAATDGGHAGGPPSGADGSAGAWHHVGATTPQPNVDPHAPVLTAVVGQPSNGGTVELQGTGKAGATVNLYADGGTTIVGSGKVGADGTFDITTTATFADGVHMFAANEMFHAKWTSPASTAFSVNVDPNAPVITAVVGQPSNGDTVELKGTGEAGETVNLYADGGTTIVGTGTVGSDGSFDITTNATFTDGIHKFTATETDAANLTSKASTLALAVNVNPNEVVFIDGQVPDLQDLLNGIKPGERVFVLNPNQDGLQQIADILAANGIQNVSAISIVGHGTQDEFTIGATDLTDNSLASEASALAAIGKSLKPGGDILLYGCEVAQGAAGQQFISDLSAYAGGANVAASTHEIGTLQGTNARFENWTLDASTGPIDASVPFTAAALADYQGLLSNGFTVSSLPGNFPNITTLSNGDIAIAFTDTTGNGSPVVDVFDQNGNQIGTEYHGSGGANGVDVESIVAGPSGTFWVLESQPNPTTFNFEILAQQFTVSGNSVNAGSASEIVGPDPGALVSSAGDNSSPSAVRLSNGDYLLAWAATSADFSTGSTVAEVFNSNFSATLSSETTISSGANSVPFAQNVVAMGSGMSAAVTWDVPIGQNNANELFGTSVTVTGNGAAITATSPVNLTSQFSNVQAWQPTALPNGDVLVLFDSAEGGSGFVAGHGDLFGEVFGPGFSGSPTPFDIAPATNAGSGTWTPENAQATAFSNGDYVITFSQNISNNQSEIYGVIYNSNNTPLTSVFQVSTTVSGVENSRPVVAAANGQGGLAFSWVQGVSTIEARIFSDVGPISNGASSHITDIFDNTTSTGEAVSSLISVGSGDQYDSIPGHPFSGVAIVGDAATAAQGSWQYSTDSGATWLNVSTGVSDTNATILSATDLVRFDPAAGFSGTPGSLSTLVWDGQDGFSANTTGINISQSIFVSSGNMSQTAASFSGAFASETVAFTTDVIGLNEAPTGSLLEGGTLSASTVAAGVLGNVTNTDGHTFSVTAVDGTSNDVGKSIAGTYGELTLNANGTYTYTADKASAINAALTTPIDTFDFTVTDGQVNAPATLAFTIYRPAVLAEGNGFTTQDFTATSGPVFADSHLTVTDTNPIGSTPVATVTISGGSQSGDELSILAADLTGTNITVTGNDSAALTLTGTASTTATQFQTVLDDVQFSATSPHSGTRTLTWSFDDDVTGKTNPSNNLQTTVDATFGPQVTAATTLSGTEGAALTATVATFTDSATPTATASDFTATINWGDGSSSTGAVAAQVGGGFAVTGTHTYAEEGTFAPVVSVVDKNTVSGQATDSAQIADAALTAGAGTTLSGTEGTALTATVATFTDGNPTAAASDFTATIDWGDGSSSTGTVAAQVGGGFAVTGTHTYAEEGTYTPVQVSIVDKGGSTTQVTDSAQIADAALAAGAGTTLSGTEGAALTATVATFTDGNPTAAASDFTATINWGDGSSSTGTVAAQVGGGFAVTGTHTYAEEGTYTPVQVSIVDKGGSTTQVTDSAQIADAALAAGAGTTLSGTEGAALTATVATFTDGNPTAAASDFTATIDWGDGSSSTGTVAAQVGGGFAVTGTHTYAEEGTYTPVQVSIVDKGGSTTQVTDSAQIADAALAAGAGTTLSGTEGTALTATVATFTDGNPTAAASDFTATINWGDGSSSTGTVAAQVGGGFAVTGTHTYAEEGTYTPVQVSIVDKGGSTTQVTDSAQIADAALAAGAGTTLSGTEGAALTATVATFTDGNPTAAASDFTATINWGDGSSSAGTVAAQVGGGFAVTGTHTYAEEGTYTPVQVSIVDKGGSTTQVTDSAQIADAALAAGAGTTLSGTEGAALTATVATFTDGNPTAAASDFTATINWGDGSSSTGTVAAQVGGGFAVTGTHTYAEEGTYTPVQVSIVDKGGSTTQTTDSAQIADAALAAGAGTTLSGTEGAALTATVATFTDGNPTAAASDFTATINWGDGSSSTGTVAAQVGGGFAVTGTHTYAEEGTYTPVQVSIVDKGGSTTQATDSAQIADAALTAGAGTTLSGTEGTALTATVATFTDGNPTAAASDFTATINWGDGSSSTGTVAAQVGGGFAVTGTHTYAEEGTYTPVQVSIVDKGGSTTQTTDSAQIADAALAAGAGTTLNGTEGAALTATVATFTDGNPTAAASDFTATINWGDGSSSTGTVAAQVGGGFAVTGTHTYAEEGTYTPVQVSIVDKGGSTTQVTDSAQIADAALAAGAGTTLNGTEGTALTATVATFTDGNPTAAASDFTATINWGDGSSSTGTVAAQVGGGFAVTGTHTYAEEGTYTPVQVSIVDKGGSTTQTTDSAQIADAPLTAAGTTLNGTGGVALTATVATFTDANLHAPLSDFTATIDWGDGTTTSGGVAQNGGGFAVTGTHTYAVSGVYTSNVVIADIGGSIAKASDTVDVVPIAPAITALVGKPVDDGTVELKGTGQAGDTVNLYADGDTTTIVGTGVVGPGGTFDIVTKATLPFTDGVHTFTATETDAANLTSTASTPTFSVDVAPTLIIGSGGSVTYVQDGSPIPLDATATADPGLVGGPLTGATVSIGPGFFAGDVLNFTNQNGITGNYDAVHGVLTLTGSASVASYNAALDSITFSSTNPNPSNDGANPARTISWSVTDGNPTNAISATVTSTVGVQAVPTVVAGADVNLQAGPGTSVVLDPTAGAYDGVNVTHATVSIASGFQSGDALSANTAGTNIHASYANGILTLTGSDTPQDYDQVLKTVTFSSNQSQGGQVTFAWQIADANLTSAVATSTVEIVGNVVALPSQGQIAGQIAANLVHDQYEDFSAPVTYANLEVGATAVGFGPGNFNGFSHADVYVIHIDADVTVADNGAINFDLPLSKLDAALGGDVVSVTASLPDGQPLPDWLHFNTETGQFAGLLPDDITASIGPDGDGGHPGHQHDPYLPSTLGPSITIEVIARDSRGNLAITDFTIDLSAQKPQKGDQHGWNVIPGEKTGERWTTNQRGRDHLVGLAGGSYRDVAPLHAMDRVQWHDVAAFETGRAQGDHGYDRGHDLAPVGRAGLSEQIKGLGWHAAKTERIALLDSLRQGVAGWR